MANEAACEANPRFVAYALLRQSDVNGSIPNVAFMKWSLPLQALAFVIASPNLISPTLAADTKGAPERDKLSNDALGQPSGVTETDDNDPQNSVKKDLFVGAIRVEGAQNISASQMMNALSPYIGRVLTPADLQDLTQAVSGVARAQGYILASTSIPAQSLKAGVLIAELDTGKIDEVRLEGHQSKTVASMLNRLVGSAPLKNELQRALMLTDDLPGVSIGKVRFLREAGRGILIVPVSEARDAGHVSIDNRGIRSLGPLRVQLTYDLEGLIDDRDSLVLEGIITPAQPSELKVVFARYAYIVDDQGTELSAYGSFGKTAPSGIAQNSDAHGESIVAGIAIVRPIVRTPDVSLWIGANLNHYSITQWWDGARSRRDRLTTLGVNFNGYAPLLSGRLRAGLGISEGIDALGATARGDPLASRAGAGGEFTLINGWANWTGTVSGPLSARLALAGQLSSRPLLATQQIAIGGTIFGRGFDFGERSGDRGLLSSGELRTDIVNADRGIVRWAQLYGFGDAGWVGNLENHFGTGTLYSVGLGIRGDFLQFFSFGLEAAFPLNTVRYDSQNKNPRVSVSLGAAF